MNGQAESQKKSGCVPSARVPIGTEKKCGKCGKIKPVSEFYKNKSTRDGPRPWCKECERGYDKKWREANREKRREQGKRWREANPEKQQERCKKWREANREKRREYDKKYRDTLKGCLRHGVSRSIRKALKGQKAGRPWESLVGYTIHDLMKHLEKQFQPGMTWEKLLKGEIHIDHRVPISAFNYETAEDIDFKKCWALKNLQPLWAKDNLSKNAKLDKPFQPSFAFSQERGRSWQKQWS